MTFRSRLPSLLTAVLGVVLLATAILSTVAASRAAVRADLDSALATDASYHASALNEYFDRAQSINLLLAHDSALLQFDPDRGRLSGTQRTLAQAQAGSAMLYLLQLYPGRISEACLIDTTGTELTRVAQGEVAPLSELSNQEATTPFYAPTLRLPQGHVFQSAPYVSPDTDQWVISNSTPMYSASGRPWGLAHFEVTLSSFRPVEEVGGANDGLSAYIVDNRTGRILMDSRRPVLGTASLGRDGSAGLRALVGQAGAVAPATVDGQRMAVARVSAGQDNANSWSVVSVARVQALGWSTSIGPAPVAMALAALLLLAFAGLNVRAGHRKELQGEARYRALIHESSDLVMVVDLEGRATFLSPSVERALGPYDRNGQAAGLVPTAPTLVDFIAAMDSQDRPGFSTVLQAAGPGNRSAGEFRLNGSHGTTTYEMTVQDLTGDSAVGGLVVTGHDVTDRLVLQQEMEHRALHDELTGLPNRALLSDRFEHALRVAERDGTKAGLLLLDLDRFKEVNDTFGHHYGDELLRQIGARLTAVLRGVDTVARLGGDEFAVLLLDVHQVEDASRVANTLLTALSVPFEVEGVELDVEASVGVVISGDHGDDATTLMQHADIAMYAAKTQHLGVCAYDATADGHSATKLAMVGDLRRALDRHELVLYYQPKVNISNGELVGAEALVRWQHPERGLILPDDFIPLAERTGLINPLTRYIMDAALAQARVWYDNGRPLPIAVNLSARNLHDERFAELVADLVARHDVPPELLELEVTESAIMIDPVRARAMLAKLSAQGFRLSLDDFGAGYTSLSQLKALPISEIKIDRSFVMTMNKDHRDSLIVQSVISLGHNLGLTLVAEGVESEDTLQALAGFGCDVFQGFHMARPIPVADFDAWAAGRPITVAEAPAV